MSESDLAITLINEAVLLAALAWALHENRKRKDNDE